MILPIKKRFVTATLTALLAATSTFAITDPAKNKKDAPAATANQLTAPERVLLQNLQEQDNLTLTEQEILQELELDLKPLIAEEAIERIEVFGPTGNLLHIQQFAPSLDFLPNGALLLFEQDGVMVYTLTKPSPEAIALLDNIPIRKR
jgi:hypothetical protein